ncbi:MAG: bifunctional phosphopantothenoylcysteine decarboxylase/phosphopantothenate--cysteine ligase CoaBC [Candidatus Eisenbacteria bacterium]
MLRGSVVVVGVSGGIAAYKACELVRGLKLRGASVIVVMTPAAAEFVTPLTFQVLSGNPVVQNLWGDQQPRFDLPAPALARVGGKVEHVDVAEAADVLVLAPATADLIARLVHGSAPDALTTVVLASRAPLVVCPAMDLEMWRQPVTQGNVAQLRARGAVIVGPEVGALASGLEGPGRLASLDAILDAVERAVIRRASLARTRVLITAGRTEEPLDPVRVLTNRSSGRMGVALAEAARDRGAEVTLVAGPMNVAVPHGITHVPVTTAGDMLKAVMLAAPKTDVMIAAAAVADYRPAKARTEKIKRGSAAMTLMLEPNPDVLAAAASRRRVGQTFVGFALETSRGLANARAKLAKKGLDLVVLNAPAQGIGGDSNVVTLVERRGARKLPKMSKREAAEAVLDRVLELRSVAAAKKGQGAVAARGTGKSREGDAAGSPARKSRPRAGKARR